MRAPLTCSLALLSLTGSLWAQSGEPERLEIPGEIVICFETDDAQFDLGATTTDWRLETLRTPLNIESARSILQWQRRGETKITNVVLVEYTPLTLLPSAIQSELEALDGVRWVAPNSAYDGDFKELIPNDPDYPNQWHHPVMQNAAAWDITLGDSSIVIGIADDGVDTDHVDLATNIWVNPGEVAGDGIDNDNNGFIDDVNGYDFVNEDNDPNSNSSGDDHGTHVAGIAAARTDNGVGVSGTAGHSTIMPLQFYYSALSWEAVDVAEAFGYAADNGAHIVNTSYNMDIWVGDPVVAAAFDYLYDNGVLHINSSGNGGALNPPRQDAFQTTLFVANTTTGDVLSGSSNYGTGIDIAAPGSSIFSTILNDNYGTKSGTSMAAPNACGVAALIWSANPGWTRDQVAAQLVATADNIDAANPGLEGLLGGGRVNAFRAVTESLPAPKLVSASGLPPEGGVSNGFVSGFKLRFDQILDPAAVNTPGAFTLVHAGPDDVFGNGDDTSVSMNTTEYLISTNVIDISLNGLLPSAGLYRFSAEASILTNPFGTAIDGDGDGAGGDSWVRNFSSCAASVLLEDNAESGTDYSVVNSNLSTGAWEVPPVVPTGGGLRSDPPTDFDGSGKCFVTQDGPGDQDVDGGPTQLTSRAFDLQGLADPYLSYARWFVSSGDDQLITEISNDDGANWTFVESVSSVGGWEIATHRVSDFVAPSSQTRLRFTTEDNAVSPSITEAGIDTLRIVSVDCGGVFDVGTTFCAATVNSSGASASIRAQGSSTVAANDFELITENCPANVSGIYFFGPTQDQAPFGDGFRCVQGGLTRIAPPLTTSAGGVARRVVDLTTAPAAGLIVPGSTHHFQFWFRDTAAGNTGFNLSDGLSVTWM